MADDVTPLASLSLTHVYYNPEDPISLLCAWLALLPQALCVVYVTLIWSTREAEVALMFAGQLACEAVNFVLKRIIKEERPARIHKTGGKGYGMPSSHAQFVFFWAVALGLFLLARHKPSPPQTKNNKKGGRREDEQNDGVGRQMNITYYYRYYKDAPAPLTAITADIERFAHEPWSFVQRFLVSLGGLVLASMVAWSRVYLGYHTPKQVLAGCLAGTLSAVGWFGITLVIRQTGLLAFFLDLPVARWFRLRDLVVEEDLCQAGWEKWESRKGVQQQQAEVIDEKGKVKAKTT
ncbi:Phosphatidic acid phosphatase type 2/haloperoxidase [Naviculisporaceae sp. PSN 640]